MRPRSRQGGGRKGEEWLKVGSWVEAQSPRPDFQHIWWRAKVQKIRSSLVDVEYLDFTDENYPSSPERDSLSLSQVRPFPPPYPTMRYFPGDKVEVFDKLGWWVGHVVRNESNSELYVVYFLSHNCEETHHVSQIRPACDWKAGNWVPSLLVSPESHGGIQSIKQKRETSAHVTPQKDYSNSCYNKRVSKHTTATHKASKTVKSTERFSSTFYCDKEALSTESAEEESDSTKSSMDSSDTDFTEDYRPFKRSRPSTTLSRKHKPKRSSEEQPSPTVRRRKNAEKPSDVASQKGGAVPLRLRRTTISRESRLISSIEPNSQYKNLSPEANLSGSPLPRNGRSLTQKLRMPGLSRIPEENSDTALERQMHGLKKRNNETSDGDFNELQLPLAKRPTLLLPITARATAVLAQENIMAIKRRNIEASSDAERTEAPINYHKLNASRLTNEYFDLISKYLLHSSSPVLEFLSFGDRSPANSSVRALHASYFVYLSVIAAFQQQGTLKEKDDLLASLRQLLSGGRETQDDILQQLASSYLNSST